MTTPCSTPSALEPRFPPFTDTTTYIISDTPQTGVIVQVAGRLITLIDGTLFVAAPQRMIRIGRTLF